MNEALDIEIQLTTVNCGACGGTYAINSRYHKQKQDYGGFWSCPYCQTQWGFGKTKIEELEKQLKREQWAKETARHERDQFKNQARAEKAAKTRIKNRVHKGVCPHCNRHFANLQQHMETKHKHEND